MTYDPDAPPPPYTPVDPLTPATSASPNSPIQNQNHAPRLRGGDTPSYGQLNRDNDNDNDNHRLGEQTDGFLSTGTTDHTSPVSPTSNFSSAAPYFEEHAAQPMTPVLSFAEHHLIVTPSMTAADVAQLPACWGSLAELVTDSDWATFANYLFPPHLDTTHRGSAKVRTEAERHRKTDTQESDDERKERMNATVAEWNEGFFGPRGVKVSLSFSRQDDREPAVATCPNCAAELGLPQQPSTSSLPSYQTAPSPARRSQSWIQRFASHAQSFGDLAEAYGEKIERNAETYGRLIEGRAALLGQRVEAWGDRVAGNGGSRPGLLDEPRGPWGERGRGWHRGGPMGGIHHSFGHHHGDSPGFGLRGGGCGRHHRGRSRDGHSHGHGHGHGRGGWHGRGRHHSRHGRRGRRRDSSTSSSASDSSTSSSSSSSSSSSDSSIESIRSRDFEGADISQIRRSLAAFRADPHRRQDMKFALEELRQQLKSQRREHGRDAGKHGQGFPENRAEARSLRDEIRSAKREFRDVVREAKREKKGFKRERRNQKREAKRERKREKKERKRERKERRKVAKAGKRKVVSDEVAGWQYGPPTDRFADLSVYDTAEREVDGKTGEEKSPVETKA